MDTIIRIRFILQRCFTIHFDSFSILSQYLSTPSDATLRRSSGFSKSLESVLGGPQGKTRNGGPEQTRQDPQGGRRPAGGSGGMMAHSVVLEQDIRRRSEASIAPPRPPPPAFLRPKPHGMGGRDRRPTVHGVQQQQQQQHGPPWIPGSQPPPPPSGPPQMHPAPPQQGGGNLVRMGQLARSTPVLDEPGEGKSREPEVREREKNVYSTVQQARDAVVAQVGGGV